MNWTLQNVRGSREAVKTKVSGESIPEAAKLFIGQQIDSLPSDTLGCVLNAFSQDLSNSTALKVTRNIQITIEGVRV